MPANLDDFKVDHLILLVGGNPLPNYVAARVLAKDPSQILYVHTSQSKNIAERLREMISSPETALVSLPDESKPKAIFDIVKSRIESRTTSSVGLHYTGGTKLMAAQARLAAQAAPFKVICSYLDARTHHMVIEGATDGGIDGFYFVGDDPCTALTTHKLMHLHGACLEADKKGNPTYVQSFSKNMREIALSILNSDVPAWSKWITDNFRICNRDKQSFDMRSAAELREISMSQVPKDVKAQFMKYGAQGESLAQWATAVGFKTSSDGIKDFAKWLEGGWLEVATLELLHEIRDAEPVDLTDLGANFVSVDEANKALFEFDVAAMRSYRLFALSCTTSNDPRLCKSKLFEAFHRARQMGGDEARTALLCANDKPEELLRKFRREFFSTERATHIFTIAQLKRALNTPESEDRSAFVNWLNGQSFDLRNHKWTTP